MKKPTLVIFPVILYQRRYIRHFPMHPHGSTHGLRRGAEVKNTGGMISVPVGPETLGRMFNVLGEPIDGLQAVKAKKNYPIHRDAPSFTDQSTETEILETGIKVIDLICPIL